MADIENKEEVQETRKGEAETSQNNDNKEMNQENNETQDNRNGDNEATDARIGTDLIEQFKSFKQEILDYIDLKFASAPLEPKEETAEDEKKELPKG